jgi:hypothetical protein
MLAFVQGSKEVQDQIMDACFNHVDPTVKVDADGVVLGDDSLDDIVIDL